MSRHTKSSRRWVPKDRILVFAMLGLAVANFVVYRGWLSAVLALAVLCGCYAARVRARQNAEVLVKHWTNPGFSSFGDERDGKWPNGLHCACGFVTPSSRWPACAVEWARHVVSLASTEPVPER